MPADDQIIRLILETIGEEKAAELAAALQAIQPAGQAAAQGVQALDKESYELSGIVGRLSEDHDGLNHELDETTARSVEATRAQRLLRDALDDTASTTSAASAGVTKLGDAQYRATAAKQGGAQALIELSRGLQDFQAAGLVGISNQIEGLTLALTKFSSGGVSLAAVLASPAGIVAGLTLLTTAAIAGGPTVKAYFDALAYGANKVPEATDALQRLNDALKANGKALDDLKEKQSLTNAELQTFTELTRKQEDLERQRDELARQRKQDAELAALRPQETRERAEGFKKAVAEVGGGERAGEMLRQSLLNIAQQTGQDTTLQEIADQADQLLRDAADGQKQARDQIQRALRFLPNGDQFGEQIRLNAPETKAERQKFDEMAKAEHEAIQAAVAESEADAAAKKQAERNQAKAEQEQAKEAKEAERQAKEQAKEAEKIQAERAKEIAARTDELSTNTPIDEQATVYAAQARARGGDFDPRTGRRTGRDPREALATDAARMARQANPNLSPDQAREVGGEVSRRAFAAVDQSIEATRQGLNLSGRNLTAAQVNQQALAATLQAVQLMGGRMNEVERAARELLQLAQGEVQRQNPRMQTLLRRRK